MRNVVVGLLSAGLAILGAHHHAGAVSGAVPEPAIETVLYSFKGGGDGARPRSRLATDSNGNLFGTTFGGGVRDMGTVFRLTNRRKLVLHFFRGDPDGAFPSGDLLNIGGNKSGSTFLGTTQIGGDHNSGTVFEMSSEGDLKVLYSFTGGHDGAQPLDGLVMDQAGRVYGTASMGGDFGAGTVFEFRIGDRPRVRVLHSFTDGHDGASPSGGLVVDSKGNLFGTTETGGGKDGTIFMLTAKGRELRVLHSFLPRRDGTFADLASITDSAGNLYGTAFNEGPDGAGTAFRLTRTRKLEVVFSFSGKRFGANPIGGLAGNFCGVTSIDGAGLGGTVFRLTPDEHTAKVLYSFGSVAGDGLFPGAGLMADAAGTLFGTTLEGGEFGNGTVFKVTGCSVR